MTNLATPDSGYRHIEIHPLSGAVGAEIHGVDIANGLSTVVFEEVQHAFSDFGVIFFRNQDLTPEQHIDFARRWGKINVNRFFKPVPSYPLIAEVRKEPDQTSNIGGRWHSDHSYDQIPATGSILYAREVPDSGGDTVFASMYAAYDSLSEGLKQMLSSLRAIHSSRHVFGPQAYQLAGRSRISVIGSGTRLRPVKTRITLLSFDTHCQAVRRFMSIRNSPCVSTAGQKKNPGPFLTIFTNTAVDPNSPAAFAGARTRLQCGITGPPGTTP